jgi:EamA domain-containing membrane protein RarD
MSIQSGVERDERTVAVENASNRWAYLFLYYALLADFLYRSLFRHENLWDLMVILGVGVIISTVYQARQKALVRRRGMKTALIIASVAAVMAAIAVILTMSSGR